MEQASGLLSKLSDNRYRFLTMEGELILEGNVPHSDGFHSNLDLSNLAVKRKIQSHLYVQEYLRKEYSPSQP